MNAAGFTPTQIPDSVVEIVKSAPPVTYGAMTLAGYPIADWVQAGMLCWVGFLLLQGVYRFTRWLKRRGWKDPNIPYSGEERRLSYGRRRYDQEECECHDEKRGKADATHAHVHKHAEKERNE